MSRFSPDSPNHIPLRYRKVLTSKLLFFDREPALYDPAAGEFFEHLNVCAKSAAKSPGEVHLDDYLKHLTSQLVPSFPFSNPTHPFNFLHKAFDSIQCVDCAGAKPVCEEKDYVADSENVRDRGDCVEPLTRLFDISREVAQYYYNTYAPQNSLGKIYFETQNSENKCQHDIPVEYCIGGQTILLEQSSKVILILDSLLFDRDSFFAVLYVLFHECICHAYQRSIDKETGARAACGKDDPFGEGWMDCVTWQVLDDFLSASPAELAPLLQKLPSPDDLWKVCRRFHDERCDPRPNSKRDPCEMARIHYIGEQTALLVWDLLERLKVRSPKETFYILSFAINSAKTTREARILLVQELFRELIVFLPRIRRDSIVETKSAPIFLEFAETRNYRRFLEKILPNTVFAECIFI